MNINRNSFNPRSFNDGLRGTQNPSSRVVTQNRQFFTQRPFRTQPTTTKPKTAIFETQEEQFKLNFDPKSGLFSTSVDQFQINGEKTNDPVLSVEQIQSIKQPKFEIFTLPV